MVDPAALEPVDERAAQRWSFLPERRDGLGHLDGGAEVLFDQGGEPRGVLLGDLHSPSQGILLDLRHGLTLRGVARRPQPARRLRAGHQAGMPV